ncbi:conserved hypothetical protein [Streptomyces viridosporus ATCC 14672]|uniref:Amidohydrolase n=1 Tax=Streptomyces viridosporus (strain ATCC 14672 / DSM 40746 / JCM 4963 / KCTC 9882 / NRRL B-12104 / FH 1290) TaxID=566461 RepID=D5ZNH8_STRV1|nr:conserved hypothetical protein [Streptomyces viridosporus ATCC 14672]
MIDPPSLVDQYCHGVLRTELGLGTFEAQLARTEGPPAPGTTLFDTQTGFAVRRWCPPLLGLEPHCPPARYLARRRELGVVEAGRRLLRGSGITTYLVDTGPPGDLTGPAELAAAGDAEAHEIVPLEQLAEQVADTSGTVESFLANLDESVHGAAAHAVAFASVAGLRHGLALAPEPPGPREVRGAAGRWLAARRAGDELSDPVLLRHLLWSAVASARPLQLHAGLGAPGARVDRADPVLPPAAARGTRRAGRPRRPRRPGAADRLRPGHRRPPRRPRAAARLPVPPPRRPPRRCLPARLHRRRRRPRAHRRPRGDRPRGDPGTRPLRQDPLLHRRPGAARAARRRRPAVPRGARPGARHLGGGGRVGSGGRGAGGRDDRLGERGPGVRAGADGRRAGTPMRSRPVPAGSGGSVALLGPT